MYTMLRKEFRFIHILGYMIEFLSPEQRKFLIFPGTFSGQTILHGLLSHAVLYR